jgi:2,4-dienoyl-CoA reductase-like NADH-dependent reductase (Old Yellow Enzyme family)
LPVAPSAIAADGHVSLVRPQRPFVTPRALDLAEIPGIISDYRCGAENAKKAGFDGVEIHGANVGGVFIANQELTKESAEALLAAGEADAVSWGKLFISNPDLPRRLQQAAPLNPFDVDTFYVPGAKGYVDYPDLDMTAA